VASSGHHQRARVDGPGGYVVTAQARCENDKEVLLPVPSGFIVSVTAGETLSCTYPASGATSSKNKPLVYLFDWGDGSTSGGSAPDAPSLPIRGQRPELTRCQSLPPMRRIC
jgi:hypothetical protein